MQIINLSSQPFSPDLYQDLCERLSPDRVFERLVFIDKERPLEEQVDHIVNSIQWDDSVVNMPSLPIAAAMIARKIRGKNVRLLRLKLSGEERKLIFSELVPLDREEPNEEEP
jgi:hypothetical protein